MKEKTVCKLILALVMASLLVACSRTNVQIQLMPESAATSTAEAIVSVSATPRISAQPTPIPNVASSAMVDDDQEQPINRSQTTPEPTKMVHPTDTPMPRTYLQRAKAGEFGGRVVTIMGIFANQEADSFNDTFKHFEDETGIDIRYIHTGALDQYISSHIDTGNLPDMVIFPVPPSWPVTVKPDNFAAAGILVNVLTFLDMKYLEGQDAQSWLDMATMIGPGGEPILAGVWLRSSPKSLVWYPKDDFEAAGYEIPKTWDELLELSNTIVAEGGTPWCFGNASGDATGWPITDWIEDIMLRTTSVENYDAWVAGELPFDSAEVKNAAALMSHLLLRDGQVYGGRSGIVSTFFADAPLLMFEDPPKCWLHKQGDWITGFFPEWAEPAVDYDFFSLPPIDDTYGKPYLMAGGDLLTMFNDHPEVRAVMEFFSKGESMKVWLAAGGIFAPHKDVQLNWYEDYVDGKIASIVAEANTVRFDGSDLMPSETWGPFWRFMTDWVSGSIDLDTALAEIDKSWPHTPATTAKPSDSNLIFHEDFEDRWADDFWSYSGSWRVTDDGTGNWVLEANNPDYSDWTGAPFGPALLGDYTIEYRFKLTDYDLSKHWGSGTVFLVFRYGTYPANEVADYPPQYVFSFDQHKNIVFAYDEGDRDTGWDSIAVLSHDFQKDVWYSARVEAYGNQIKGYLNGRLLFSAEDSRLSSGSLLFATGPNTVAQFDDIRVTK